MNLVLFKNIKPSEDSMIVYDKFYRSQYVDMLEGEKISAVLPRSWKKSFNNGIVIPVKMRRCDRCKDGILCITFNNRINENKEFD